MSVLVTGASVGFGAAIVKRLIKANYKVIALARREDKLKKLQSECGSNCKILVLDVRNTTKIKDEIDKFDDDFRNVDILINNAGLALGLCDASVADIDDWEKMIEINVLSLIRLTRAFLPNMVKNRNGHIVNIGSIAGSYPYPGGNVYGATKAFVKQFSLNLRADLFDKNIRVTNIEPGLSGGSEFSLVRFKGDKEAANKVYENTKPLLPEDIAEAVFFAISQPKHININRIEMMPTTQAPSALNVFKG